MLHPTALIALALAAATLIDAAITAIQSPPIPIYLQDPARDFPTRDAPFDSTQTLQNLPTLRRTGSSLTDTDTAHTAALLTLFSLASSDAPTGDIAIKRIRARFARHISPSSRNVLCSAPFEPLVTIPNIDRTTTPLLTILCDLTLPAGLIKPSARDPTSKPTSGSPPGTARFSAPDALAIIDSWYRSALRYVGKTKESLSEHSKWKESLAYLKTMAKPISTSTSSFPRKNSSPPVPEKGPSIIAYRRVHLHLLVSQFFFRPHIKESVQTDKTIALGNYVDYLDLTPPIARQYVQVLCELFTLPDANLIPPFDRGAFEFACNKATKTSSPSAVVNFIREFMRSGAKSIIATPLEIYTHSTATAKKGAAESKQVSVNNHLYIPDGLHHKVVLHLTSSSFPRGADGPELKISPVLLGLEKKYESHRRTTQNVKDINDVRKSLSKKGIVPPKAAHPLSQEASIGGSIPLGPEKTPIKPGTILSTISYLRKLPEYPVEHLRDYDHPSKGPISPRDYHFLVVSTWAQMARNTITKGAKELQPISARDGWVLWRNYLIIATRTLLIAHHPDLFPPQAYRATFDEYLRLATQSLLAFITRIPNHEFIRLLSRREALFWFKSTKDAMSSIALIIASLESAYSTPSSAISTPINIHTLHPGGILDFLQAQISKPGAPIDFFASSKSFFGYSSSPAKVREQALSYFSLEPSTECLRIYAHIDRQLK